MGRHSIGWGALLGLLLISVTCSPVFARDAIQCFQPIGLGILLVLAQVDETGSDGHSVSIYRYGSESVCGPHFDSSKRKMID